MSLDKLLRDNAVEAAEIICKYLKGDISGSDKVKIASLTITQCVKYQATKGAHDCLRFAVMKSVAADRKELKAGLENSMPEYLHTKLIGNDKEEEEK